MRLNFAANPANVKDGLLATRTFHCDRDVLPDKEFLSFYVTDTSSSHIHCNIE